ncbi:tetraacyldisaccharide 4'-kinase [Desulfurispira natronophila]|uniref:Tetraacyldisaccharide 4'-kinase n=1 Tax=Desulfurispira natronophila TaxID=682562 RepID=A0A7W7Y302_9BACT|nr:tetraacyldisaccharide 4'-kinase [Desulfurispira natronophila]MBB5021112.1 tetraacyldisaccharide 4'-kinase [Desulfurispira natronophila]
MTLLDKYLYGTGWWRVPRTLAAPLSLIYPTVSFLRYLASRPQRLPCYTIGIGNLTAGGTGKTPVAIALANRFTQHGYRVGILSRGYNGSYQAPFLQVTRQTPWHLCGDEPLLMAHKTEATVVVSRERIPGARHLLQEGCQLILLDDAFSNHKIHKDYEILLEDFERPLGNGLAIPAGTLREFSSTKSRADIVMPTRVPNDYSMERPGVHYHMLCTVKAGSTVNAYSALGNNQAFFAALEEQGYHIHRAVALPDHSTPDASQWDMLLRDQIPILTTEKDAIKLDPETLPQVSPVSLEVKLGGMDGPLRFIEEGIMKAINRGGAW